jgi:hypothetical protein
VLAFRAAGSKPAFERLKAPFEVSRRLRARDGALGDYSGPVASIAGLGACWQSVAKCSGPKEYVPDQTRVSCNSPEFKELRDQNQNTYRPYAHHCSASPFAPMVADLGRSTNRRFKVNHAKLTSSSPI